MILNDTHRTTLQHLIDLMIPPTATVDTSSAEIGDAINEMLPKADTALQTELISLLDQADAVRDLDALARLEKAMPAQFSVLELVILSAYFAHPDVRCAYGYDGQVPRDSSAGLSDNELAGTERIKWVHGL